MAGQADRVAQDLVAIAETREQLSEKLKVLDRRVEDTVGKRWGTAELLYTTAGNLQKLIVLARVGISVFRFVTRRPWIMTVATVGAVLVIKTLLHQDSHTARRGR